jgi:asparagine synthase (glutamine-hydrolysing)
MCGIAGFINPIASDKPVDAQLLDRMCRVIEHRGPDDQGMSVCGGVALGMRRLAIIDLEGGRQPISSEDGNATIVFNGEIYNFQDLKRELEARGHRFGTHSDTEAIVHAYEEFGTACVERLRGMFAFAIWDEKAGRLFLARDRVGKKPLYYTQTRQGAFVFASELKSLLQHPEVGRELDPQALDAYLTLGYVPDPLCIFRDIRKLPPGYWLSYQRGRITLQQYWDLRFTPGPARREEEIQEELLARLEEAVRIRLVSDVPLGAFLSGGVDSSTVVALMARQMGRPVKTFSIGFHEDSFNELKYARLAAAHFGTDHHEFIVTPEICDVVDQLVWHFDEPFADASAIPTYAVSRLARDHVTVVLSGDGGDEVFAGYNRYVVDRKRSGFASRMPRPLRRGLLQPLSRHLPHGMRGRNYLHNIAQDPFYRYLDSVSVFTSLSRASLYTPAFREQLAGCDDVGAMFQRAIGHTQDGDPLHSLLYLDSKTYLPGDILTKVDRMSMAASLEARAPLLDHTLIEFAATIPASLKMKGLSTKYILKRTVSELVPAEILHRPKQGFGVPISHWINAQLRDRIHDTLLNPRTLQRGFLDERTIKTLLTEHHAQRRNHATQLWALFILELWYQSFLDGAPANGPLLNRAVALR